jgi:hypothetical protein
LGCSANRIADLAPLRGLPLRDLACWANPITDLRPLRGLPLHSLHLDHTFVTDGDLWPLEDLPLHTLYLKAPYVIDLGSLSGLPLRELYCDFRPERHPRTLRGIKSLQKINGVAAEEFWNAHDARRAGLEEWRKRVAGLPAPQQVDEVAAKLRELNPGFKEPLEPKIENGQVVELSFASSDVTDLAPLRGLPKLRRLAIAGAAPVRGRIYDLDPIRGLPLLALDCSHTELAVLNSLEGMKLVELSCADTFVRDLTPARGLPLRSLDFRGSRVGDVAGLRGLKTLQTINGKAATEFWKASEAR